MTQAPRRILAPAPRVTPASLRAEGILEIGRATNTSVLFVLTNQKLHLFHELSLPERPLDDYAVQLAVTWIESGVPAFKIARGLGVSTPSLQRALESAGYFRLSPSQLEQKTHARAARKLGRRGKLVHVGTSSPAPD